MAYRSISSGVLILIAVTLTRSHNKMSSHMPSVLAWVDHDEKARERTLNILSMFQEKESRDELGLGAIRDSISDQLFPGTSTIQTRLKYMLFIPWIYQSLENKQIGGTDFAAQADRMERELIHPLMASDDQSGVFGKASGQKLKRLPSSVYWTGLGAWGIRQIPFSQGEYHARIDEIYKRRRQLKAYEKDAKQRGDDIDVSLRSQTETWHRGLPLAPKDFPAQASFALTHDEAEFIRDRLKISHPDSLLTYLAFNNEHHGTESFPWEHTGYNKFSKTHQELLTHARLFSEVMHGAAILYNIMLARCLKNDELISAHENRFHEWIGSLPLKEVKDWDLSRFWQLVSNKDHTIASHTKNFITSWVDFTRSPDLKNLHSNESALNLIKQRETKLKNGQSRFTNRRALDQWGGSAGLNKLVYRWNNVKVLLRDLYNGLNQEDVC